MRKKLFLSIKSICLCATLVFCSVSMESFASELNTSQAVSEEENKETETTVEEIQNETDTYDATQTGETESGETDSIDTVNEGNSETETSMDETVGTETDTDAETSRAESDLDEFDEDNLSEEELQALIEATQEMISTLSLGESEVSGDISVDGIVDDWYGVTKRSSGKTDSWAMALSADGNTLYAMYTGTANSQWDYNFLGSGYEFNVNYTNGAGNGRNSIFKCAGYGGDGFFTGMVKDAWYGDISGSYIYASNKANQNNAGPYVVECSIPVSFFGGADCTITFGGTTVSISEVERISGINDLPEEMPVYQGINIDGGFTDWDAVTKYDVNCANSDHKDCISQAAAIWDGEYLYIYIKEGFGSSITTAGTHSNGKFAIMSDLGFETDFQLKRDGTVAGVDGVLCRYVGSEWELAFPLSTLPNYTESLSLQFYLGDNIVPGIVNLQGVTKPSRFSGVTFDGEYDDWEDYPHHTIEYATAGSQNDRIDAKGAVYWSDSKIYAHVITDMPAHLKEAGGEFTKGVTFYFNSSDTSKVWQQNAYTFGVRVISVNEAGNINWNPKTANLPNGTYKYYITSLFELPFGSGKNNSSWGTSKNINDLIVNDTIYGEMIMTIGIGGKDEMEMVLYADKIAAAFECDESDLKLVNAQFIRIGDEWISYSGTSTAPFVGVGLCIATVAVAYGIKRKRLKKI